MRTRSLAIVFKLFLLLCALNSAQGQGSITLDHVEGAVDLDKILTTQPILFYFRLSNGTGDAMDGLANGFRVYSPEGIQWTPRMHFDSGIGIVDTSYYGSWVEDSTTELFWCHACPGTGPGMFNLLLVEAHSDDDSVPSTPDIFGSGVDTVGFGAAIPEAGVPSDLSRICWMIEITDISDADVGKSICIDSSSFRYNQDVVEWSWSVDDSPEIVYPTWDGPHCFTITDKCCWGMRGNINLDWKDTIDISDLTSLVGWMFKSGSAPPCMLEADVDGNSDHDIADVTHLVGYMFKGGPEPEACP